MLLAPALLLSACSAVPPVAPGPGPMMPHTPQPAALRFTVEPRVAAPGSTVTLILYNGTGHAVGYNLCMSGLGHMQPGTWGELQTSTWRSVPENRACTRELRTVPPGQEARYQTRLPATLAPGEYRFRTGVERPLSRDTPGPDWAYSHPFTVRR